MNPRQKVDISLGAAALVGAALGIGARLIDIVSPGWKPAVVLGSIVLLCLGFIFLADAIRQRKKGGARSSTEMFPIVSAENESAFNEQAVVALLRRRGFTRYGERELPTCCMQRLVAAALEQLLKERGRLRRIIGRNRQEIQDVQILLLWVSDRFVRRDRPVEWSPVIMASLCSTLRTAVGLHGARWPDGAIEIRRAYALNAYRSILTRLNEYVEATKDVRNADCRPPDIEDHLKSECKKCGDAIAVLSPMLRKGIESAWSEPYFQLLQLPFSYLESGEDGVAIQNLAKSIIRAYTATHSRAGDSEAAIVKNLTNWQALGDHLLRAPAVLEMARFFGEDEFVSTVLNPVCKSYEEALELLLARLRGSNEARGAISGGLVSLQAFVTEFGSSLSNWSIAIGRLADSFAKWEENARLAEQFPDLHGQVARLRETVSLIETKP